MALAFAKIRQLHGTDIVNEFFAAAWEAELKRKQEYDSDVKLQAKIRGYMARLLLKRSIEAAVNVQRIFRGYIARQWAKRERDRIKYEEKLKFWNSKAVQIQKIWKGYWSRKSSHDFYGRRQYLKDLVVKMDETRQRLAEFESQQKVLAEQRQKVLEQTLLIRLANKNHHLLSTRAIPGIMARVSSSDIDLGGLQYQEGIEERLLDKGKVARLPPLARVPESRLKMSDELREWVQKSVGKNYWGVSVKPSVNLEHAFGENQGKSKLAQGPFLPRPLLNKKKYKPFQPTLRVETDFYDTHNYWREQRKKESTLRVTDKAFVSAKHIHHKDIFLGGGPYKLRGMTPPSRKPKEMDRSRTQRFKNVTAPVPLFEDLMNY